MENESKHTRYPDDTVINNENYEDLERKIWKITLYSEEYGQSLNIKKAKSAKTITLMKI